MFEVTILKIKYIYFFYKNKPTASVVRKENRVRWVDCDVRVKLLPRKIRYKEQTDITPSLYKYLLLLLLIT